MGTALGKGVPSTANSTCKGPEAGVCQCDAVGRTGACDQPQSS